MSATKKATEASGKFLLRVPRELHRDLAKEAEAEGVSLNQHVATILARMVGQEEGAAVGFRAGLRYAGWAQRQLALSKKRPKNYAKLTPEQQWEIDKKLGMLDWDGK
jgi:hypothetical protein